jgi:hypothetical protein
MSNPERRVALILHGPPASGKTTLGDLLLIRLAGSARIFNLDAWWGLGEPRHLGWPHRYADLAIATEPVAIMQLSLGEPADLRLPGATSGANEWLAVLQQAGREVFGFRLLTDWADAEPRLRARHQHELFRLLQEAGAFWLYAQNHPLTTFPPMQGFKEHPIRTGGGTTPDQSADEIMRIARLP